MNTFKEDVKRVLDVLPTIGVNPALLPVILTSIAASVAGTTGIYTEDSLIEMMNAVAKESFNNAKK